MLWIALHLPRLRQEAPASTVSPESESMLALAAWASQFTPRLSLGAPTTLLLEVSASLTLFKGLPALLKQQRAGLKAMGHSAAIAVAPTPLAAEWLARAGIEKIVGAAQLEARLAALPVTLLEAEEKTFAALDNIGVRILGEVLALPRAGVARRFGNTLLEQLDRALGLQADPRPWYVPPPLFRAGMELPAAVEDAAQLLFAARRLVLQLCGYLAGRAAGVQRFLLELRHDSGPATLCLVGLVAPAAESRHFLRLLRERLQRTVLPSPVIAMVLTADAMETLAQDNRILFQDGVQADGDWRQLVEHLRARLGKDAVSGLSLCAEHRPEYASVTVEPGGRVATTTAAPSGERPLWLLAQPLTLTESQGQPQYQGTLQLLRGPERIESGWWDGGDVRRDYFIARNREGALLWICRQRQFDGHWLLHGYFA